MASRYWVGGTGTWDGASTTNWAASSGGTGGASVPTIADDVFFDASSGGGTVTISVNIEIKSLNCTGFTGSLSPGNRNITINGDLTFATSMTFISSGSTIIITNTSTIITAGRSLNSLTINAPGQIVNLSSAITLGVLTFTAGTFRSNNLTISCASIVSQGTQLRSIELGGSTVTLSRNGSGASSALYFSDMTNLNTSFSSIAITFSGTTSSIELPSTTSSLTFGSVTFNSGSPVSVVNIKGNMTCSTLTFAAVSSDGTKTVNWNGPTQTIGTLNANSSSVVRRFRFKSTLAPSQVTLNVTGIAIGNIDFQDINAQGSVIPWSGSSFGNAGGNTNITFTSSKTVYWNLAGSVNSNATGWASSSGAAPAIGNFPLPQDTAVIDNSSAGSNITFQGNYWLGSLDTSNRTTSIGVSISSGTEIIGNVTLSSAITFSPSTNIIFNLRGTSRTITSAGKSFSTVSFLGSAGSTLNLGSDFVATSATIPSGYNLTFNANSYNVSLGSFICSSGTVNMGSGLWTITSNAASTWMVSNITLNKQTANILFTGVGTGSRTANFDSYSYNKITIGGTTGTSSFIINGGTTGPTFSEIASTKTVAHTIVFPAGLTTTVGAFTVVGSSGNLVTLQSSSSGSPFTIAKTGGGTVSADYLIIKDSNATPSNTWYAGNNSIDNGGNTGWIFPTSPSNFLMFFV